MGQGAQSAETQEPDEIKNTDKYKVMPDLSEEEYEALKKDIAGNGVKVEVVVGAEEGHIIDGHHRDDICDELGIENYPIRVFSGTESEKYSLAWRLNMQRRHFSQGEKRERIEDRLLQLDERGEHKTDQEVARELGVSRGRVTQIRRKLSDNDKFVNVNNFITQEKKRKRIKQAIEKEPEKSDRQIASDLEIETTQPTVSSVRKEMASGENEKTDVKIEESGEEEQKSTIGERERDRAEGARESQRGRENRF